LLPFGGGGGGGSDQIFDRFNIYKIFAPLYCNNFFLYVYIYFFGLYYMVEGNVLVIDMQQLLIILI